jgi:hypothetical protein
VAKIVVVEDEAELAAAIAARLRSDGHSVAVAEDGPGAVRLVASGRPDAVVLDLMLPGFDGLAAAVWIGIVFVLLGATFPRRGLPRRRFPAAVVVSGLVAVGIWGASNPASIVAQTNLRRAGHGHSFDVGQAASLGPDAGPALVAGLRCLGAAEAIGLRRAICAQPAGKDAGAAFNLSRARANEALIHACGSTQARPGHENRAVTT